MRTANKAMALTLAERCKNILSGNWQGHLNTIKADAKGSDDDVYTSKIRYLFKRGKPYMWIQEGDMHNVNTLIDERGSLSVTACLPGPLMKMLRSLKKLPPQVALIGDVVPLSKEKATLAAETLKETIISEQKTICRASYAVSGILSSSGITCNSRSEKLQSALDGSNTYSVYKFGIRSCTYIDGGGGSHEIDLNEIETTRTDPVAPFAEKLIDGINQSQARRRALMLFCLVYLNKHARDAFILSLDRKGFDVLGKVPGTISKDGASQLEWKEFRFSFKQEARDVDDVCQQLVKMEEDVTQNVESFSGLGR